MFLVVLIDYTKMDSDANPAVTIVKTLPTERQAWKLRMDLAEAGRTESKGNVVYAVYTPQQRVTADLSYTLL